MQKSTLENDNSLQLISTIRNASLQDSFLKIGNIVSEQPNSIFNGIEDDLPTANLQPEPTSTMAEIEILSPKEGYYVCPYKQCGKSFSSQFALVSHKKIHKIVPFVGGILCPGNKCFKIFRNQNALDVHKKKCSKLMSYSCPHCAKIFKGQSNLFRHIIIHTEEWPFRCDHCGKKFNQKSILLRHMQEHIPEETHACNMCPAVFKYKCNLTHHQRTIHIDTEELKKLFSCPFCNGSFKNKIQLSLHHAKYHQNLTDDQKIQNTIQNVMKDLQALTDLTEGHVKENPLTSYYNTTANAEIFVDGVRWYKCKDCDRSFKKSYSLNRHAEIHKTGGPFECGVCKETFRLKTFLILHERSEHNIFNKSTTNRKKPSETKNPEEVISSNTDDSIDLMDYANKSDYCGKFEIIRRELFDNVINFPTEHPQINQDDNICSEYNPRQDNNPMMLSQNVPQTRSEITDLQEFQMNADEGNMAFLNIDCALGSFPEEANPVQFITNNDPVTLSALEPVDQQKTHLVNSEEQNISDPMNTIFNYTIKVLDDNTMPKETKEEHVMSIPNKLNANVPNLRILSHHKEVISSTTKDPQVNQDNNICSEYNSQQDDNSIVLSQNVHLANINPKFRSETTDIEEFQINEDGQNMDFLNIDCALGSFPEEVNPVQFLTNNDPVTLITLEPVDQQQKAHLVNSEVHNLTEPSNAIFNYTIKVLDDNTMPKENTEENLMSIPSRLNASIMSHHMLDKTGNITSLLDMTDNHNEKQVIISNNIPKRNTDETLSSSITDTRLTQEKNICIGYNKLQQNDPSMILSQNELFTNIDSQLGNLNTDFQELQTNKQNMTFLNDHSAIDFLTSNAHVTLNEPEPQLLNSEIQNVTNPLKSVMNYTLKAIDGNIMLVRNSGNKEVLTLDKSKANEPKVTILSNHKVVKIGNTISLIDMSGTCNNNQAIVSNIPEMKMVQQTSNSNLTCEPGNKCVCCKFSMNVNSITPERKIYKCDHCPTTYNKQVYLSRHLKKHCSVKSFVCYLCGKGFKFKNILECHKKIHMEKTERETFHCKVCGKTFLSKGSLKLHTTIHSEILKYECQFCKKIFRTSGSKINHIRKKHIISENQNTENKKTKKPKRKTITAIMEDIMI